MPLKSSAHRYGAVAITIHWLTAIAILALLVSGTVADGTTDPTARTPVLRVHVIMGSSVVLLTIIRIAWWLLADDRPAPVGGMPVWQARAAHFTHMALYAVIIVMGASGIGTILLSGAGPVLFGGNPTALPDFRGLPPRGVHGLFANAMIALALLHVAAALYHQFIGRDRLLARMGIGGAEQPLERRKTLS